MEKEREKGSGMKRKRVIFRQRRARCWIERGCRETHIHREREREGERWKKEREKGSGMKRETERESESDRGDPCVRLRGDAERQR